ncbi:hypothetical protein ACG0Z4_29730 [Enterocloster aldenensis]|uniref:hypothetical protein n=1 Tax=Enterocloster aldenensis TaxID=358742 RepID=UPI004027FA14
MKAKKENKVYTINTEQEAQRYLKDGFDIYDDDGNVRDYSPKKRIAYSEYMKAVKEIGRLQAVAAEKEAENEALKAEIAALQQPARKAESKKAGE